jgi:hypothetical protein
VNIGVIDTSATLGTSWLHRCSPVSKLVAFALVLAGVVVTWNLFVVLALLAALSAAVVSARLKARLAFGLAAYPALFALIFALASAPGLMTGAVIVFKAVTAALAAVTIVLTTPYPQVFAPLQRVVPVVVGDALLMTYRSVFLLLEKFSNLLRAMRLRAGLVVATAEGTGEWRRRERSGACCSTRSTCRNASTTSCGCADTSGDSSPSCPEPSGRQSTPR